MKHFFGATPDGRLYWTFVRAGGYDGTAVDLDADDPQDSHAQHLLSVHNKNMRASETLDSIVVYECPCPPGNDNVCDCTSTKRLSAYCKDGVLTDKPTCQLLIDGVPVSNEVVLTRYPNSLFTAQLVADDPDSIDDDETATIYSQVMLETSSEVMTFSGGSTNTVTLRAPSQGLTGALSIGGKMVCAHRLFVKGFAATPS